MIRLRPPRAIFWDFDGVVKDSVDVKTQAYVQLFLPDGAEVSERVRMHHLANGGMSRFDKIPLYLQWAGKSCERQIVDDYCNKFSQLAFQGVIDSPWVDGVETYLRDNPNNQQFILITATPQGEIEDILKALNLTRCFDRVYGAPMSKKEAISLCLDGRGLRPHECLVIGDARADMDAAQSNNVPFLLRRHRENRHVFEHYNGDVIESFIGL